MSRRLRQAKILELIEQYEIFGQEELMAYLSQLHLNVNQSTVSRDIKELGLIKIATSGGHSKYAKLTPAVVTQVQDNRFFSLFRQCVTSIHSSENLIVIKTMSGSADAAASAVDYMNFPEVLGTLAGDDTLLLVIQLKDQVEQVKNRLLAILQ